MNVQVNDSKVCVCVFLMFVTAMCVFVSYESVEWVAFVYDSIKIEGAEKKIFAEGHGCLCFLWYGERPQIVILWVGWLAGEVEMVRYWWEASFGCVLVDRPTSVRQRTWLSWANKLDSDIIRLCCCLDYYFFTDGIYLLPTSYYYDFHKWAKCDPWTVKK